jgi:hypothetical protein
VRARPTTGPPPTSTLTATTREPARARARTLACAPSTLLATFFAPD